MDDNGNVCEQSIVGFHGRRKWDDGEVDSSFASDCFFAGFLAFIVFSPVGAVDGTVSPTLPFSFYNERLVSQNPPLLKYKSNNHFYTEQRSELGKVMT